MSEVKPLQPTDGKPVWYRGWEVCWDEDADYWIGEGWRAYKGGCDLGAPLQASNDFVDLLDLIDDEED